jgi:hypothetical protein
VIEIQNGYSFDKNKTQVLPQRGIVWQKVQTTTGLFIADTNTDRTSKGMMFIASCHVKTPLLSRT